MAQKGSIIFALDNRGSTGRGHVFEEPIHFRFGAQEMSEQRDGAAWLKTQPWVDAEHIGIWGWSYGGDVPPRAQVQWPTDFKPGFWGSPVTKWPTPPMFFKKRKIRPLHGNEERDRQCSHNDKAGQL